MFTCESESNYEGGHPTLGSYAIPWLEHNDGMLNDAVNFNASKRELIVWRSTFVNLDYSNPIWRFKIQNNRMKFTKNEYNPYHYYRSKFLTSPQQRQAFLAWIIFLNAKSINPKFRNILTTIAVSVVEYNNFSKLVLRISQ